MANAIYGLYPDPDSAQRAVDSLRAAGVEARDITVISSEPWEECDFGRQDRHTPMPWLAALGGLIGGTSCFLLATLTQKAYPLVTGGMPILALWPSGIVTYELTMLGAILVTLLTLLVTARLPNWRPQLSDPAVADGLILVGAVNPPDTLRVEIERRLKAAGAAEVKEFGPGAGSEAKPQSEGRSS